jgi:hypothetical protein
MLTISMMCTALTISMSECECDGLTCTSLLSCQNCSLTSVLIPLLSPGAVLRETSAERAGRVLTLDMTVVDVEVTAVPKEMRSTIHDWQKYWE